MYLCLSLLNTMTQLVHVFIHLYDNLYYSPKEFYTHQFHKLPVRGYMYIMEILTQKLLYMTESP